MKHFFVFFLLVPFFSLAQDCKLKKEIDQFSQLPKLTTAFLKFNSTAGVVSLSMEADNKEIKLLFSAGDSKCFDEASTAAFSYEGTRSKSNLKNYSAMNCDGIFTIIFRNGTTTPYVLQNLATKNVASVVLTDNTKKKIEIFFKEEEKQLLKKMAACMATEAKTLIKH